MYIASFVLTLKQTHSENGRVTTTKTHEMAVSSQPQRPMPLSDSSAEMENKKIFNMVILGGFLQKKPIVKIENVIAGLKKSLSERYHHLIPLNEKAIHVGMQNIHPYKNLVN